MEGEGPLRGGLVKRGEQRAPEKPAEDTHREKEAFGTRNPGGAIQGEPASRDETMDMGMMVQRLPPSVQHSQKPDLGPQMPRLPGNRLERRGHGLKQQGIDHTRILQGERT